MDLAGRNALLTGGSRGIGPVIAEALARRGVNLALAARSEEPLRKVCDSLRPLGVRVEPFAADLADARERERLVERVGAELGRVDLLVNNAGLEPGGEFVDQSWEEIRHTIEVNLGAPVHLTRLLLPAMIARGEGSVVNIASVAGKVGAPYDAVYSGTKAALARWSEGLRREIAGRGVAVSTVFPGYVTEVGMFARFGMKPPALVGSCTPVQVAEAVAEAARSGRPDRIVNSHPLRPMIALAELFPSMGDWLLRRMGVVEFQQRKAHAPPPGG